MTSSSRMTRESYPMPEAIRAALAEKNLTAAYEARPPYQRNDYIGWITGQTCGNATQAVDENAR